MIFFFWQSKVLSGLDPRALIRVKFCSSYAGLKRISWHTFYLKLSSIVYCRIFECLISYNPQIYFISFYWVAINNWIDMQPIQFWKNIEYCAMPEAKEDSSIVFCSLTCWQQCCQVWWLSTLFSQWWLYYILTHPYKNTPLWIFLFIIAHKKWP